MTKVRMLVSIASPDWSYIPQEEVDIDDDLARAWAFGGHCVILGDPTIDTVETPEDVVLEGKILSLGGSWYQLPDGIRIQGKAKALEALKAIPAAPVTVPEGGEINGTQSDNTTSSGTTQSGGGEATPPS